MHKNTICQHILAITIIKFNLKHSVLLLPIVLSCILQHFHNYNNKNNDDDDRKKDTRG